MPMDDEYYYHPKVVEARRLLCEAEQDIRTRHRAFVAAQICECGCRRDQHGPSYSINYTGGICLVCNKGEKRCMNFLHRKEQKPYVAEYQKKMA